MTRQLKWNLGLPSPAQPAPIMPEAPRQGTARHGITDRPVPSAAARYRQQRVTDRQHAPVPRAKAAYNILRAQPT